MRRIKNIWKFYVSSVLLLFVGSITFSQIYTIDAVDGQTINTCSGVFYDSGGLAGPYDNNASYLVTFCSGTSTINLSFSSLELRSEGGDTLRIYDGSSSSDPLIGEYADSFPAFFVQSTGSCLTIEFTSDDSLVNNGWEATLDCCPLPSIDFIGLDSIYDIRLDGPVTLTGMPSGGIFSGNGISGDVFTPLSAGIGYHSITYTYTDIHGCVSNSIKISRVADYNDLSGARLIDDIHEWCSANAAYSNILATGDGTAASCWTGGTGNNVWFKFVATGPAVKVDVRTGGVLGSMRGQQAAIWNSAGVQVACNETGWNFNGTLPLSMDTLTIGHTYFISVDDLTTHGTFTLCVDDDPGFDFESDALLLSSTDNYCSSDAAFSNTFATGDGAAGSCWSGGTSNNVWFTFVAETEAIKIDVKTGGAYGSMRGQQVALWNSSGTQVACNETGWNYNGTLSLSMDTLTTGNTYYISVDDRTTHGTFTLCTQNGAGYDFKSGAEVLYFSDEWCSSDAQYSNIFATRDGTAGSCWSGGTNNNVWFKFLAETGGITVEVKTGGSLGSMRGQQIALWNEAGEQIACNDAGWNYSGILSLSVDTLTAGNLYYISVDDQTTNGSFTICLDNKVGFDFKEGAIFLDDLDHWCSPDAQFSNRYATADGSAGSCWSGGTGQNVWFRFVAVSGQIEVDIKTGTTFGTMRGQQIAIWNTAGIQIACIDGGWNYSGTLTIIADTLTPGNTYYISVDDQTQHGTFTICANNKSGYDYKSGAILLPSLGDWCSTEALYSNRFATRDEIAGSCWAGGTNNNVWFRFVASTNAARIEVKTGGIYGSMRGQQVAVWNEAGTQVACNDAGWNFSGTLILGIDTLKTGHTYYISVDDQTTHGSFTLCLDNEPWYDFRSGAVMLTDTDTWCASDASFSNSQATPDGAAGPCWSGSMDHNVWFSFVTASNSAEVLVKTGGSFGSMRGQQIALWNADGMLVGCMDAGWNFSGTATLSTDTLTTGRTYYISVDDQTNHGTFTLCVSSLPGYDFKAGAVMLSDIDNWCGSDALFDNRFATGDENAGSCWSGGTDHNVWFKFTAVSGQVQVDVKTGGTHGSMRGQQIALWNEDGTQLACINGSWNFSGILSLSVDTLTAGRNYYISVDDQTTHGTFTLCVNNKVGFDFRQGALPVTNLDHWCSSNAVYDNRYATPDAVAGSCWTGGTNQNVWFRFNAIFDTAAISVTTGGVYGSMRGQQIAVWTSGGAEVACSNAAWNFSGISTVNLNNLIPGNTYYISVDDRTTAGSFSLCVNNVSGNQYWAINNGDWNTASNWSRTEGGPPASSPPGASNIVHIKGYTITVTGSEACAGLNLPVANNHTLLIIDGGSLQVNGVADMTNNGSDYQGIIQVTNGGELNVEQDLLFNRTGGTESLRLEISGSSNVTTGQDLIFVSANGSITDNFITLDNTATLTINRDLKLLNSGGPATSLTLNNSSVLNAWRDIVFAASIQERVAIHMNDNSILNLYGNFQRGSPAFGTLASNGNATLIFRGSSYLQSWPQNAGSGTDGFSYMNVVINNTKVTTPQVTLEGPVTVNGSVSFIRGVVSSTSANPLILESGVTVSGASDLSYVDGPVKKIGNAAFTFPIGNSGNYQPLSVSSPVLVTDAFTAQYFNRNSHPVYNHALSHPSLTDISACEYWSLVRNSGTSNLNATLSWDANSCCIGSLSDLQVAVWEGTDWTNHGNGGTTGTPASGTIQTDMAILQDNNILSFGNTLPVVSFAGLNGSYCASASPVILTGSPATTSGEFTGAGITDHGDGTASFDPALAGAGTFNISYIYTDPLTSCQNINSQPVIIYSNPKASMYQPATVCKGSKADLNIYFTGSAPWDFEYTDGTHVYAGTSSTNPYTFQVTDTGTYHVTELTDARGCMGSDFGSTARISNFPQLEPPLIDTVGPAILCEGSSVTLSTIPEGSFAIWSTGETSYSIVVTETGDYNVKIVDINNCVSPVSDITHITVNKVPRKPIDITANTSVCQNGSNTALSTFAAYATSYVWSVSPPVAGVFTGSGASVTLDWDPLFQGVATITVKGNNILCGEGPESDPLTITVNALPSDPGPIDGPVSICRSTSGVVYSIDPVTHATYYSWSLPSGASISGSANGNSITVNFGAAAASGDIAVTAVNGCGPSFNQSVASIAVHNRPVPSITGPVAVNLNDTIEYSTEAGMNNYLWVVSPGGQIVSGGGTADNTIRLRWIAGGAQVISIDYENADLCNALSPAILSVTVSVLPGKPFTPSGETSMCSDSPETPYTSVGATGATSYIWYLSPAAAGSISGTGLTGTVSWSPGWYGTAYVSVSGQNANGTGPVSDALEITIHKIPETGPAYSIPNDQAY